MLSFERTTSAQHNDMNIKPIPSPSSLVADITSQRHVTWSDEQRTLLRALLRFDNWTRPPTSYVAPVDILRHFTTTLTRRQRLHNGVRYNIERIVHRWTVTITITLE